MTTTDPREDRDPLEALAEDFVGRLRRGERPALTEYADRNPELADRIRTLFPTLVLIERVGPPGAEADGPPDRLGEYRLLREVGRGGMGVVYEAEQVSLGRRVAVKVLPPERCLGKWPERFEREARAAAGLHHTNIVPVFGVGRDGPVHFYVMQYIPGCGLDRVIAEARRLRDDPEAGSSAGEAGALARSLFAGRFPAVAADDTPVEAAAATAPESVRPIAPPWGGADGRPAAVARLGRQAADALAYAHVQGVLHRDVKPSNLLLDARGTLWVADFGLAKAAGHAGDLTDTGDLVGTLRYMAPERFRGACDERSDVYALGATLYELLALRPAFDAPDRLGLMDRIAYGDVEPLRRANPAVGRDLETIVHKAMARRPEDRYQSAAELAEDLARFLDGRPVQARRVSPVEVAWRWARRRPAVAALSAAVGLLVTVVAAGGWWAADRLLRQVHAVSAAEKETTDRLWEARAAEARAGRASRLPGQRLRGLEAVAEAARIRPTPGLRNEAVACLALYDVRVEREWDESLETNRLEYSTGAAFDADLEHYAFTDAGGTVTVCAADGRVLARLAGRPGPADYLRFSPDGRYLAARFNAPGQPARIWEWRTGRVVVDIAETGSYTLSLDFHPGGGWLAVGVAGRVNCYSLPGGKLARAIRLGFTPGWLAFEPGDGRRLAVCGADGDRGLRVLRWADGTTVAAWTNQPTVFYAAAWQRAGGPIAVTGQDGNVYIFDPSAGAARTSLRGHRPDGEDGFDAPTIRPPAAYKTHQLEARELAFTPDGSVLLTRGWDATTRLWDPAEGRELLQVRGTSFLQVSRDGRRVGYRGYNSRRLGVWELVGGDVCRVLHPPGGPASRPHAGVSFSPDGVVLAVAGAGGVNLWDVRDGRLLDRLVIGPAVDVRFDPRGRWLYAAGRECSRFRLDRDPAGGWRVGARDRWPTGVGMPFQLATDRAGDVFAAVERFNQVLVTGPGWDRPVRLVGHPGVSFAAVSPDGRLVATGPSRGSGVRVWRADDGRPVSELPAAETAGVAFSPDGRHLLVLEPEGTYRCYAVGSWEVVSDRREPDTGFTRAYRVAFHPDGRTFAQVADRVSLRLVDLDGGEELAVLPVPDSHNLAAYEFSPDGRYVAAVTVRGAVQLWDLEHLRSRLRELGLDWPGGEVRPLDRPAIRAGGP